MSSVKIKNISIPKNDMKAMLAKIMEQYRLVAPASNGKVVDYLTISDVEKVVMDDRIPYKSPKEFFFPRCEKIISFDEDGAVAAAPGQETVVFGVKPCDLEALAVMTRVFTMGKFQDPFFIGHRENNVVIGVGCREKKPGCFCERLAVDMSYSRECDLFLEDRGDSYEVLYVSDKGRDKLSAYLSELASFENPDIKAKEPEAPLSLSDNEADMFDNIDWEAITETCQSCGLCTYICPTCHCFDFKDVEEGGTACRYRNWDSCMFPKFTLHASGHNPRDTKKERYRQRVLHKYLYVPKNFDAIACTGCGRCIRSCPAGVNIRQVVEGIVEVLK